MHRNRSLVLGLILVLGMGTVAQAQDTAPNQLVEIGKQLVDYLDPTPEVGAFLRFKDIGDKNLSQVEGFAGISGALYKFTSHDIELGSFRLGGQFEGNRKFYTTLGVNGIGLAKRYLSEDVKAALSPGVVAKVWDVLEAHGSVAGGIGLDDVDNLFSDDYTLSEHAGLIGTVGLRVNF